MKKRSLHSQQEILNSIGEAIFIHDAQTGVIVDVNESMLYMYGYKRHEVIGKSVGTLSSLTDGFTAERAAQKIELALRGETPLFEWVAKRKDGSTFWVEVSLKKTVIEDDDYIIAVVRDIADKKQTEIRLKFYSEFQRIIADLSTTFISLPISEFNHAINLALKLLGKNFKSDRAYVFAYSDDHSFMSNTHEWCETNITPYKGQLQQIPTNYFEWHHKQLIRGKTIKIPIVSEW